MRLRHALLFATAWLSCCTSTAPILERPEPMLAGVTIDFESTGKALNLWDQHIAELGDPKEAQDSGSDYWYRLSNSSGQPISFRTASMYLERKLSDWHALPNGTKISTLAEGRRILILFDLEDRKGRPIPYGGDVSSISSLESGRSILFSVPRAAFQHRQRVGVSIRTLNPDTWRETGATYRAYLQPPTLR